MNRNMAEIIRNRQPICLRAEDSIQRACEVMHDKRIGAILITNEAGHLTGIFTGRDVLACISAGMDVAATTLRDVMTRNPATMPTRSSAIEALRLMQDGGFRHIPVVEQGSPIGIVSRGDFRGLEYDRLDVETGLWERLG